LPPGLLNIPNVITGNSLRCYADAKMIRQGI
jgi:hypothetical protein